MSLGENNQQTALHLNKKFAVFALTRGYRGRHKWRYLQVIFRNHFLFWAIRKLGMKSDFLLFHEGNVSESDQIFIQRLSPITLNFINVSDVFKPSPTHQWTGSSEFALGYSLMCKFNTSDVWQYVKDYDVVCRVDEDCMVKSLPNFAEVEILTTGGLSNESHARTLSTLPKALERLGLGEFFDQKFPYTNVYLTRVNFWLRPEVQGFVLKISNDPLSLEMRWGDLPVLGVALKAFGAWVAEEHVSHGIEYFHLSHKVSVSAGEIRSLGKK
jgi:hypothetical protein